MPRRLVALSTLLLALSSLNPLAAWGGELTTRRTLRLIAGDRIAFRLVRSIEPQTGERQVTVYLEEARRFLPDTEVPVLYGRDLDSDGRYDSWFFTNADGDWMSQDRPSTDPDGWDTASVLIATQLELDGRRWLLGILLQGAFRNLTITGGQLQRLNERIRNETLHLKAAEIQMSRIEREDPASPLLPELHETLALGWDHVGELSGSKNARTYGALVAVDVGLSFLSASAFKALGVVGRWALPRVTETAAGQAGARFYSRYLARTATRAAAAAARFRAGARKATDAAGAAAVRSAMNWATMTAERRVVATLRWLDARGAVSNAVARGLRVLGGTLRRGYAQKRYIGGTELMQLLAEGYQRRQTLLDPNLIVMADRVTSDEELLRNMMFMTSEAFLMTSVHGNARLSVPRRFVICGLIGMVNSTATTLFFKSSLDPAGTLADGGWEALIGNSQVFVDTELLPHLLKSAAIPGARPLGFALAMVDQAAGFTAYSWLTRNFDRLIGRVGSAGAPLRDVPQTEDGAPFAHPRLTVIPIYEVLP
jgi:hypothetical protein